MTTTTVIALSAGCLYGLLAAVAYACCLAALYVNYYTDMDLLLFEREYPYLSKCYGDQWVRRYVLRTRIEVYAAAVLMAAVFLWMLALMMLYTAQPRLWRLPKSASCNPDYATETKNV